MGDGYEAFLASKTALPFGLWVEAGCPTEASVLAALRQRGQERVLESLAQLPRLQDSRGLHLDEVSTEKGPDRRCEDCSATFATERYGGEWVLPEHGHHSREHRCAGSRTPGAQP